MFAEFSPFVIVSINN